MFIIYGLRHYGRVDGIDDEYATTQFVHVYYLPLVPLGSMWVTGGDGDEPRGHDISLAARSVAAGYLRVWGPLVAAALLWTASIGGVMAAALAVALTAWSWTWRQRKDPRERRRAAWHQVLFGTACDPLRMRRTLVEQLRPHVERGFVEVCEGRTPHDIARFGARSPDQALLAYGALRMLAATARRKTALDARAASEQVLDEHRDRSEAAGGPYRAANPVVSAPP